MEIQPAFSNRILSKRSKTNTMKILQILGIGLISLSTFLTSSNNDHDMIKTADGGALYLKTTYYKEGRATDILLTKVNAEGNEEWFKRYGGRGYDKSVDFLQTSDGGLIILGHTSSYGKGNYDIYLLKVDATGKEQWSKTFGGFYNEYGKAISINEAGEFRISGTKQVCYDDDDPTPEDCITQQWIIKTDALGNKISDSRIEK